jgi:hypothetical protein
MICNVKVKVNSETHKNVDAIVSKLIRNINGKVLSVDSMSIRIESIDCVFSANGSLTAGHTNYLTTYRVTYDTDITITKKANKEIIFNELVMNEL